MTSMVWTVDSWCPQGGKGCGGVSPGLKKDSVAFGGGGKTVFGGEWWVDLLSVPQKEKRGDGGSGLKKGGKWTGDLKEKRCAKRKEGEGLRARYIHMKERWGVRPPDGAKK